MYILRIEIPPVDITPRMLLFVDFAQTSHHDFAFRVAVVLYRIIRVSILFNLLVYQRIRPWCSTTAYCSSVQLRIAGSAIFLIDFALLSFILWPSLLRGSYYQGVANFDQWTRGELQLVFSKSSKVGKQSIYFETGSFSNLRVVDHIGDHFCVDDFHWNSNSKHDGPTGLYHNVNHFLFEFCGVTVFLESIPIQQNRCIFYSNWAVVDSCHFVLYSSLFGGGFLLEQRESWRFVPRWRARWYIGWVHHRSFTLHNDRVPWAENGETGQDVVCSQRKSTIKFIVTFLVASD